MLKNFRTYQLAVSFHRSCLEQEGVPGHLRDQLYRASGSIVLNLAEGSAKPTRKDQAKFYFVAMGSLRESQAALEFVREDCSSLKIEADRLGASIYRLIQSTEVSESRFWKK